MQILASPLVLGIADSFNGRDADLTRKAVYEVFDIKRSRQYVAGPFGERSR
ncbi:hypothetical protein [Nocardia sp. NPDC047648]|uniref:hypothetical protein n=1 Tax=Nocardia sp. NPDC047648 TaxID=3155625 RepID=UPI0033C5C1DC